MLVRIFLNILVLEVFISSVVTILIPRDAVATQFALCYLGSAFRTARQEECLQARKSC